MKVLFIGGSGVISSACTRLAIDIGVEVYVLNRGLTATRPLPESVQVLRGDIRDRASTRAALSDHEFDAVVDWVAYTPDHIDQDIELFSGRTRQFVFISSASAYQHPPSRLPVVESEPLRNPILQYSRDKIACEEKLLHAFRDKGFPSTIVRPSHTYDRTAVPLDGGWTMIERMRQGRPIVVHGDGTSLWTLTHHADFARGFVALLGHPATIGSAYHITSDEVLTWNQIVAILAHAAGVTADIVYIPSTVIRQAHPGWGDALLGDKAHSMIFDNAKLRSVVPGFAATIPFHQGAQEIVAWHDADPSRQTIDEGIEAAIDTLLAAYRAVGSLP